MSRLSKLSRRALLATGVAGVAVALLGGPADARLRSGVAHDRDAIKQMIRREARRLGVSVPLGLAVAHVESYFDARAESHKGARGVMQIMPKTSREEYGIHPDLLWDARINIRLGLHFLGRLIRQYGGRVDLALSHYNGGSAVGRPPRARIIPATRGYVRKVMKMRRQYRAALTSGDWRNWTSSRQRSYSSRRARAAN
ncbi:MAG: lytic transglycosylase domain-containing protein [Alphaproteobacteria bacterium]|nr:lytic transglycosylase domain-containing protein [Alphaproteobacteria bacterium]